VIHVSSIERATLENPGLTIPSEDIIGIWNSTTPARYPRSADFGQGNTVVVRPLQRIVSMATVDWNSGTIQFDLPQSKTMRQLITTDDASLAVTPAEIADFEVEPLQGSMFDLVELPNIWFAAPTLRGEGSGLLRLDDGQQFVLGGDGGFRLAGLDADNVSISRDGRTLTFPLSRIYALNLPD
jgi:hypothetical protein